MDEQAWLVTLYGRREVYQQVYVQARDRDSAMDAALQEYSQDGWIDVDGLTVNDVYVGEADRETED